MIDINQIINDHVKREIREREPNTFFPSEICDPCIRKQWFNHKTPKQFDADTLRIFLVGDAFHYLLYKILRKASFTNGSEFRLYEVERSVSLIDVSEDNAFTIRGRLDDVICLNKNKELVVIEGKSTKSLKWLKQPNESHRMQLNLYLRMFGAKLGLIIYMEKNTFQTKTFTIGYDHQLFLKTVARAKKLQEHLKNNTLPLPTKTGLCGYCRYEKECSEAKDLSVYDLVDKKN